MFSWPLTLRLALRELRGHLRRFSIFIACLSLGIGAIAAVGSITAAIKSTIATDARVILGGDVSLRLVHSPATPEQLHYFTQIARVSSIAELRAMARALNGSDRALAELRAVDNAHPLYGQLTLSPDLPLVDVLAVRNNVFGAAVEQSLLDRLSLRIGDKILLGTAAIEVRAVIRREPDRAAGGFEFGPRVIISQPALATTGLIQPGSLISYEYRLALPPSTPPEIFAKDLALKFPTAAWRIRDLRDPAPGLSRFVDRVSLFMTLVGLTALLVGGIGVSNAVRAYLSKRTVSIAVLKCLGAPSNLVSRVYLIQILFLAIVAIALGLIGGAIVPFISATALNSVLPLTLNPEVYPLNLAFAGVSGVLVAVIFTLGPLSRATAVSGAALFRDRVSASHGRLTWRALSMISFLTLILAALAVTTAQDRLVALWFVLGSLVTIAVFRFAAWLIILLVRRIHPHGTAIRLAISNIHRVGAPTAGILLSLGLGLTLMVAISLIQSNFALKINETLPENAPSLFFIDIQPDQVSAFETVTKATSGVTQIERVPMLRGRIVSINGTPVETAKVDPSVAWVLQGDRGLTVAATPSRGTNITAGSWWPTDYQGPPLISLDAEIAKGFGVTLGDRLGIDILGRTVEAKIASLRQIDWGTLGINFIIVFAPGTLEGAPQTHLAAVYSRDDSVPILEKAIIDGFPNISAIRVKEALAAVDHVLVQVSVAIYLIAAITLLAGVLVLAGAVAASHQQRLYDAVVLKVLGATPRLILRAFIYEYGFLGLAAAGLAAGIGTLAAWAIIVFILRDTWVFLPLDILKTTALALILALGIGLIGTWRALQAKPAAFLRSL